jgi:hypothetical protein
MRLEKQEDGFKLKQLPLERGLHVGEWDSACYSWLDFWAWKYDYTLFYVEHEGVYRSFSSAEFPNGIRGGLYLVNEDGSIVEGPRDFEKFYVPTKPEAYVNANLELPQGQRNFLKW